ncbi:unnamed protein product [Rhizoctonia solani]|uniref:Uncharacterized protein n=1 Tax=Rhizoctonia solani TaxID=456999 RepID=A0A8H2WIL5_9AGAM|nr:unnamed protein product [Rhizoctonia solani]
MFFSRFIVAAISFGAISLAAPIGMSGIALPVGGLLPGGSSLPLVGSIIPADKSGLPVGGSGLPLPIGGGAIPILGDGGAIPALGGGNKIKLPLISRSESTYAGSLDKVGSIAGGLLGKLNGASGIDAGSLLSELTSLNGALGGVKSVLEPLQGLGVDSLLCGLPLGQVTNKTKEVFTLVQGVMAKIQSLELTGPIKSELANTVGCLTDITSGLAIAPQVQSIVKGLLGKVLGLVGGLLGGLGLGL